MTITEPTDIATLNKIMDAKPEIADLQAQLAAERQAHAGASIMASDACKAEQKAIRKLRERDEGNLQLMSRINFLQEELAGRKAANDVLRAENRGLFAKCNALEEANKKMNPKNYGN